MKIKLYAVLWSERRTFMRMTWQNALRVVLALAMVATLAVAPALVPSSCMVEKAEGKSLRPSGSGQFAPHSYSSGRTTDVAVSPDATLAGSRQLPATGVITAPAQAAAPPVSGDSAAKPQADIGPPAAKPSPLPVDPPTAARIDPALPGPTNLTGTYTAQSGGNVRSNLSWTKANPDTNVVAYLVLRWDDSVFSSMASIFNSVAAYEPAAYGAAQSFAAHRVEAMQVGLTVAERQAIAVLIVQDLDTLFGIISGSTQAAVWTLWGQLTALATSDTVNKSQSAYQDNKITQNKYYFYVVVATYAGGDTSRPTNCWGLFAYQLGGAAPAQPTGFTAIAYDPGVALAWSPNQEMNLSGYNVYLLVGSTAQMLNATLITQGTEYFHMTGAVGSTYYVEAVNTANTAGTRASAVSVLAAASYYYANDPGWVNSAGTWALENYASDGGNLIRVAQDPPSRTGISFNGRRVRLYCATYCQSGNVRVWVDGVDRGTYSLYSASITWGVAVYTITGLSKGTHTIELECLGTGGVPIPQDPNPPPPVPITRNFVNVQYIEVR
jgi:hypothetical protein